MWINFMTRSVFLLTLSTFFTGVLADKATLLRLQTLIENDDSESILAEKNVFEKVINDNIWPVKDCSMPPVLYAIQKHSNKALKALLEVPGVKPNENFAKADTINGKYPEMYLLHVATLTTSLIADDDNSVYAYFARTALCDAKLFKQDQETWDIIKTIPDVDVNKMSYGVKNYAHFVRYTNCTAMHFAALTNNGDLALNNLKTYEGLDMNSGSCVDLEDAPVTPFELASVAGNVAVMKQFLEMNPKAIESLNAKNDTLLFGAAMRGDLKLVELILSFKSSDKIVNLAANTGFTALHIATQEVGNHFGDDKKMEAYMSIMKLLLERMSAEGINAQTKLRSRHNTQPQRALTKGKTALHIAIISGIIEAIEILIKFGGDKLNPNIPDTDSSFTALHMVGYYNLDAGVRAVLSHPKIDCNILTKAAKRTALHTAIKAGATESVFVFLKDSRVNLDTLDGSGYKPEDWAKGWFWGNQRINNALAKRRQRDADGIKTYVGDYTPIEETVKTDAIKHKAEDFAEGLNKDEL